MIKSVLLPLKRVANYSARGSVGVAIDRAEKEGWVWEYEYDCKRNSIKEWGKVNLKTPEYTFKSSMLIGIKIICPNQKIIRCQEYQGGAVTSQSSAKSSAKVHNNATTVTLIYYGLTDIKLFI